MRNVRIIPALLCAFIFFASRSVHAQALDSVAGLAIDYVVTNGVGAYEKTGKYRVFISDTGNAYYLLRLDSVNWTYGTSSYEVNDPGQGTITMSDAAYSGQAFWSTLNYSTSTNGTFVYTAGFPAYESGNFLIHSGNAPGSIDGKVLRLTVTGGSAPFRSSGVYQLVTPTAGKYVMQELSGAATAQKLFRYDVTNRTTGRFTFTNSFDGASAGFMDLTFSGETNGVFVMRDKDWTGYQEGKFSMTDFYTPSIVAQPAGQTVPVGTRVVFSTRADGSGPFLYQWYKNNSAISGATSTSYILSSAQTANAGSYRVVAKNAGGSATSSTAVLSVYSCSYTLSSNAAFFHFSGGNGAVRLSATNGCGWTASSTNSWVKFTSATNGSGSATITFSVLTNSTKAPRIGALNIAEKLFTIAQGADFAPTNIAGKNLIFYIKSGTGAPTNGGFVLSTSTSTTNTLRLIPTSTGITATNGTYIFYRTSLSAALLKFNARTVTLNFSSAIRGTFQISYANGSQQSGSFALENRTADFNSDGRGDFAWQNSSGDLALWMMQGTSMASTITLHNGTPGSWGTAVSAADLNRDGFSDLLFQTSSNTMRLWLMKDHVLTSTVLLNHNSALTAGWKGITATDFNDDQKPDVLFQNDDGRLALWLMNGTNLISSIPLRNNQSAGSGVKAVAATDLNGDRQADILFQNTSGVISAWLMSRTNFVTSISLNNGVAVAASLAGAIDLNSDGSNDLLWQKSDGTLSSWLMSGLNFSSSKTLFTNQPVALNLRCIAPK